MPRSLPLLVLAALAAGTYPPRRRAGAHERPRGRRRQQASIFDQPAFQRAKFKRVRYFVAWKVMANTAGRLAARGFVQRARRDGFSVLLHVSSDNLQIKKAKLPSVTQYKSKVGRLVTYLRGLGVREFGTWNEANHASQPTYRSPTRAAQYNRSTRFWFTETGRIVKFGRSFPCSTSRAASRLKGMFELARTYHSSGVDRAYVYNWTGAGCDARFDAGLTGPDGSTRAGYSVLRQQLPNFLR